MRMLLAAVVGIAALAGSSPGRAHGFEAGARGSTLDVADATLVASAAEDRTRAQLQAARELLETLARPWPDALTRAVTLAKAGTAAQARSLSIDVAVASMTPTHASPSQAAATLASLYGVDADPRQLARLDQIAGPAQDALTRLIDAFASVNSAARAAFGSSDPVALQAPVEQVRGKVNPADVFAARDRMLDAVRALRESIGPEVTNTESCSPITVPPAFSIDVGMCDNTYTQDIALLVDAGGNDTYFNNAGGSNVLDASCSGVFTTDPGGAGALIDLSGDDIYGDPAAPRSCGVNGGGYYGSGFLLDAAGSDMYNAGSYATNGGSENGAGFLLDAEGDDTYTAGSNHTNGGNGFLIDAGGNDAYTAGHLGTNGSGYSGGNGFLLDAGGDDTYTAGAGGTNGGGFTANSFSGSGFLLDAGGNDTYSAGAYGTNGGGYAFDASPIIEASAAGVGFLLDAGGNDTYIAGGYPNSNRPQGTNGGGSSGLGFVDTLQPFYRLGVGLLLDAAGTDTYFDYDGGTGADCTRAPKWTVGAQIDLPNTTC